MSDSYLAVVKQTEKSTAVKLSFVAATTPLAMEEMRRGIGARNIEDIYEYDLMRISGRDMVLVSQRVRKNTNNIHTLPATKAAPKYTEAAYNSYELKVA